MKRSSLEFVFALGLALTTLSASVQAGEQLTAEKLITLDRVSSPTLSRDGKQIAYLVEAVDPGTLASRYALFVAPSDDLTKARAVVKDEKGAPQFVWANEGDRIFYLSGPSGSRQLWVVSLKSGDTRRITDFAVGINAFSISADGRLLVTAHDVFPDCPDLACTSLRAKEVAARKDSTRIYKDGELPRSQGSYGDERFVNLFGSPLPDSGMISEAERLTPEYRGDIAVSPSGFPFHDYTVAPDSETIYFAARPSGNQTDESPKAIYRVAPGQHGDFAQIIADSAQSLSNPRISPDGKRLAYLKVDGNIYTAGSITVWIRDLVTGRDRQLADTPDEVISGLNWSPDGKTLYVQGPLKARGRIFAISAGAGGYRVVGSGGSLHSYSVGGGRLAYLQSSLRSSPEIAVVDAARPDRLRGRSTFAKGASERFSLGETVEFSFAGWNGEPVQGFLVKPAGFVAGRKYPVVLSIHGGPYAAFLDEWQDSPSSSPQLLAEQGYAVVMINPHGSSSFGSAFGRSALGHWGDRPLEDLQKGWEHVIRANAFLDPDRACAMGFSYGGYLALLIAGRWNQPWKCLVVRAGIFDARSIFYTNDLPAYNKLSFVPDPWRDRSYETQNPINFIDDWKVPMFISQGGEDYRVPLDQSIGAYRAALLMKVPAQFVYHPDEPHAARRPHNVLRLHEEMMSWIGGILTGSQPATMKDQRL